MNQTVLRINIYLYIYNISLERIFNFSPLPPPPRRNFWSEYSSIRFIRSCQFFIRHSIQFHESRRERKWIRNRACHSKTKCLTKCWTFLVRPPPSPLPLHPICIFPLLSAFFFLFLKVERSRTSGVTGGWTTTQRTNSLRTTSNQIVS